MPKVSLNAMKMFFGFALLGVLVVLAIAIGTGKMQDPSTEGPIVTTIAAMAGAFSGWAFSPHPSSDPPNGEGQGTVTPPASAVTNGAAAPTIKKVS